jgi:hypothetical protein
MPSCVKGWLDKDMTWLAPPDGSPGRPAVFSDAAIQFCLTIKVLFKLPLRQKTLAVQIPYRRTDGPLNLLVDSTGIKFLGDGALSGDCFAIPCRVTNGRRASTVFRDAASRCPAVHACMHERDQPPSHRDHPDPQERTALKGRLPSRNRQKRDPTSHSPLWPGILDALDRIPRP